MRRLQHKIVYKTECLFKSIQFVKIFCFTGLNHIYDCKKMYIVVWELFSIQEQLIF